MIKDWVYVLIYFFKNLFCLFLNCQIILFFMPLMANYVPIYFHKILVALILIHFILVISFHFISFHFSLLYFFFILFFFHFILSRVNVATAVNILSSTSTSFGGAQQIDEKLQKQLLDEEEKAMSQFKVSYEFVINFAAVCL